MTSLERLLASDERRAFFELLDMLNEDESIRLVLSCHPAFANYFREFFFSALDCPLATFCVPYLREDEVTDFFDEHPEAQRARFEDSLLSERPLHLKLLLAWPDDAELNPSQLKDILGGNSLEISSLCGHEAFEEWTYLHWIQQQFVESGGDGLRFACELKAQVNLRRAFYCWLEPSGTGGSSDGDIVAAGKFALPISTDCISFRCSFSAFKFRPGSRLSQ